MFDINFDIILFPILSFFVSVCHVSISNKQKKKPPKALKIGILAVFCVVRRKGLEPPTY